MIGLFKSLGGDCVWESITMKIKDQDAKLLQLELNPLLMNISFSEGSVGVSCGVVIPQEVNECHLLAKSEPVCLKMDDSSNGIGLAKR